MDWVSTDIGLGNAMAAPGVYTDEEGSMFLNHRYSVHYIAQHISMKAHEPSTTLIHPIMSFITIISFSDLRCF